MSDKSSKLLLIIILLIGLKLRTYKINNPLADWHSWRQADTAAVSRNFLRNGIDFLHPKFDDISDIPSGKDNPEGYRFVEFPIPNAIHALAAKTFPRTDFVLVGRSLSVLYSLISIILLFYLLKFHTDTNTALLGSLIFAIMPYNIYYSRVILPEPLLITTSLSLLLSSSVWIKRHSNTPFLISLISLSILLLLKAYMAVFIIPVIYLAYEKIGPNFYRERRLLAQLILGFLPFILWFLWIRQFPEGIPHFKWAFNGDNIRFRPAFFYWIFGVRIGTLILGVWGTVFLLHGLIATVNRKHYFFLFWSLAILIYFTTIATANVRHDYYQAISIPLISSLVAIGSLSLWRLSRTARAVTIFALTMMFLVGWQNIRGYYQINHPEILVAGKDANSLLPPDAKVVAPYNGDTAFLYQIDRKGWPYVTLPINELIQKGATHYVSVNFDNQTREFIDKFRVVKQTPDYVILELKPKLTL